MRAYRVIAAILSALCCVALAGPAASQGWPAAKPITMVVPVPPGPTIDQLARLVGSKLSEALGQTQAVGAIDLQFSAAW